MRLATSCDVLTEGPIILFTGLRILEEGDYSRVHPGGGGSLGLPLDPARSPGPGWQHAAILSV